MPSSYRVLSDARLVLYRPRGSLDVEDLSRVLQPLRYETPGESRWNRVVDFTGVEEFDLDYQGILALSASLTQEGIRQTGGEPLFQMAILCYEPFAFGLARMIASILERNGIQTRPFRDLMSLCSWLAIPPDTFAVELSC